MSQKVSLILLSVIIPIVADAEFRLSELSEKRTTKREKAFTEWVTPETAKEVYERYERKGQFPIYHESSEKGERRIYEDNPDSYMYQFWFLYGEKAFCDKDRELRDDMYVLLTASKYTEENGRTLYRGIWVATYNEKNMQRVIKRYGISQAYISEDHQPE